MDRAEELQVEVLRRQEAIDADDEKAVMFKSFLVNKLNREPCGRGPLHENIWISSDRMANFYNEFARTHLAVNAVSRALSGLNVPGLEKADTETARGWRLVGDMVVAKQQDIYLDPYVVQPAHPTQPAYSAPTDDDDDGKLTIESPKRNRLKPYHNN
jgi:hypothetical protein